MVELDEDEEEEKQRETAVMDDEAFSLQGMNGAEAQDLYDTQEINEPGDDEDNYEDDFEVGMISVPTNFMCLNSIPQ